MKIILIIIEQKIILLVHGNKIHKNKSLEFNIIKNNDITNF